MLGIIGEFISALCFHSVNFVLNVYFNEFNVSVSLFFKFNKGKHLPFLFMFMFGSSTLSACLVFFKVLCFVSMLEKL